MLIARCVAAVVAVRVAVWKNLLPVIVHEALFEATRIPFDASDGLKVSWMLLFVMAMPVLATVVDSPAEMIAFTGRPEAEGAIVFPLIVWFTFPVVVPAENTIVPDAVPVVAPLIVQFRTVSPAASP